MVGRPSRLETLVEIAQVVARRGTCSRLQVGAVIHREGRILSSGYNGAPAGVEHCDHRSFALEPMVKEWPDWVLAWWSMAEHTFETAESVYGGYLEYTNGTVVYSKPHQPRTCSNACHAERNAIDWAARHGTPLLGAELVTTDTPCLDCARSIINAGISAVYSFRPYRDESGVKLLHQARVEHYLVKDCYEQEKLPHGRH